MRSFYEFSNFFLEFWEFFGVSRIFQEYTNQKLWLLRSFRSILRVLRNFKSFQKVKVRIFQEFSN
jgi:hypothetical protein